MAFPLALGLGLGLGASSLTSFLSGRSRPDSPSLADRIKFGRFGVPMISKSEEYPAFNEAVMGLEEAAKPKLGEISREAIQQQFQDLMSTTTAKLGGRRMLGGTLEANVTRGAGEEVMRRLGPTYKQMEVGGATAAVNARAIPLRMWLERQEFMRSGANPVEQQYQENLAAHSDKWKTIGNLVSTGTSLFGSLLGSFRGGGTAKLGQSFPGDYYG